MSTLQPGDRVDGRFEVESVLGEGGLARVYRVRHLDLGATFALKMLLLRKRELAERLIVEGRIQAQLRHPNIVAVIDLVRHGGQLGLLMEYVDHQTLQHYLDRTGALSVDEGLELLAPVFSAVVAAHDAGITHRDLKPANVMLATTPRGLVPKVADFGIAKVVDEGRLASTASGRMVGTPGYLAPEQLTDSAGVDERADVFALGAIAYRVFSGRNAYQDEDGGVSIDATLRPAPPLHTQISGVPDYLEAAIHKAIARERHQRFPDVRTFAAAMLREHPTLFDLVDRETTDRLITLDGMAQTMHSITSISGPLLPELQAGQTIVAAEPGSTPISLPALAPATVDSRVGRWAAGVAVLGFVGAVAAGVVLMVGIAGVAFVLRDPALEELPPVVEVLPPEPAEAVSAPPEVAVPEAPALVAPAQVAASPVAPQVEPQVAQQLAQQLAQQVAQQLAQQATDEPLAEPIAEPVVAVEPVAPDPVVAEPEPAVAEVELPAPPSPAPTVNVAGDWSGKANNVPFALALTQSRDGAVSATGTFQVGATTQNVGLTGRIEGARLSLDGGGFSFVGFLSGGEIRGTYRRGKGKDLAWSVAR